MSDDLKHSKVTTSTPQDDGSIQIVTESYYEQLAHQTIEIEKQMKTSRETMLKDMIDCTSVISRGAPRVVLIIEAKYNEPNKIIWRWTSSKESFNRR